MEFIPKIDPLGNIWLSSLVALIPIVVFFMCLVFLKLKAHICGFFTVVFAILIAIFVYDMPAKGAFASFILGFTNGLWPIAWIIIAAIFLYKLSIKSGQFEILKQTIMQITPDHRIQVILIGFCFGGFLEGAIGFGGPVAITAALLVGLGLKPLQAAGYCMIANTVPVAFGAVGIPVIAMTSSLGLESLPVAAMVGRILTPLSIFIPFFIIFLIDGIKGIKETFPVVFIAAFSFALSQYFISNYQGAELAGLGSAVISLLCSALFMFIWQPKNIFRFDGQTNFESKKFSTKEVLLAWSPFILLIVFIAFWNIPYSKLSQNCSFLASFKDFLSFTNISIGFSNLGGLTIIKPTLVEGAAVSNQPLTYSISLINTAGTAIFFAALSAIFVLKVKKQDAISCFSATLSEMAMPIVTIGLVVSFAYITNYSGASATLGVALSATGDAFAFFSPLIGWVGVFLTGSDTSANLLFGALQKATANNLNMSEILFLAANSAGGVVGKMISPQSIAIACAAVGLVGREGELFKFTLKYAVALIIIIGIWIYAIAHYLPFMVIS